MKKNDAPAFRLYAADFLADENVAMMDLAETGAYVRLLLFQWREGSIPADPLKLARLLNIPSKALALLWPALEPCFIPMRNNDDRLVNPRMERERKLAASLRRDRASAGSRGGKAKRDNALARQAVTVEPAKQTPSKATPLLVANPTSRSRSRCQSNSKKKSVPSKPKSIRPLEDRPRLEAFIPQLFNMMGAAHPNAFKRPAPASPRERKAHADIAKLAKQHSDEEIIGTLTWVFTADSSDAVFWRRNTQSTGGLLKVKDDVRRFERLLDLAMKFIKRDFRIAQDTKRVPMKIPTITRKEFDAARTNFNALQFAEATQDATALILKSRIDGESYDAWLAPMLFHRLEHDGTAVLVVPSVFFRNWIASNYLEDLEFALGEVIPSFDKIQLLVMYGEEDDAKEQNAEA